MRSITRIASALAVASIGVHSPIVAEPFPWQPTSTQTLVERFPAPDGTRRLAVPDGSFGAWLRSLPVKPEGTPVHLFDGRRKPARGVHVAVVDLDVGRRDLQQCADAVIRLRAEYLWSADCAAEIAFDFTSGDRAAWTAWSEGQRPRVHGNAVTWRRTAEPDASYRTFRRYLDTVFAYAGSHSLAKELERVDDPGRVKPGDVFLQGGFPGHAVIVLDVVEDAAGARHFLLAQSYMPAQDLHVLANPRDPSSPWYTAYAAGPLDTPEWRFDHLDLRRFPRVACERPARTEPLPVAGDVVPPRRIAGSRSLHLRDAGCDLRQPRMVIIQTVIDATGQLRSVDVLKGGGNACVERYIRETLADWRFEPATLDGEPVAVTYNLTVGPHLR